MCHNCSETAFNQGPNGFQKRESILLWCSQRGFKWMVLTSRHKDQVILRAWNKVKKGPSLNNCRVLFVNFVLVFFLKSHSLHPIFYFFTWPSFLRRYRVGDRGMETPKYLDSWKLKGHWKHKGWCGNTSHILMWCPDVEGLGHPLVTGETGTMFSP